MRLRSFPFRSTLSAILLPFLAAACGGGGGGGAAGGAGTFADIYVTDAPADELLSFQVTIDELRLVAAGVPGSNQLSSSATVELLGLSGSQQWLVREDSMPAGLYDAIQIVLHPGSVVARDKQGALVAVDVVTSSFAVPFATPLAIGPNEKVQLVVDIQLAASLSGTAAAPPMVFDPTGAAFSQPLSTATAIDEIQGIVQSSNGPAGTLVIDAFADGDLSLPLGPVSVALTGTTLLIDQNGAPIASASAFFASLVAGSSLLEVHGAVVDQQVVATRIEVEDHSGGQGSEDLVRIEGQVANLDALSQSFDLLIIEVEKGAQVAGPVLGTLGNPASIPVEWTAGTLFFQSEHQLATSAALAEGARIKAKFAQFGAAPFLATKIELEHGPEIEGRIVDISGLPDSVVIHVDGDEPSIASGQVASSSTPVTLLLSGSSLFLDTQQKPALSAGELLVGLKIEAQDAQISGPPSGPTITALKTKVFAGRFEGHVSSISPGLSSFNASMVDLKDPFGDPLAFGPVTVELAPGVVITDEANSPASFFALFGSLGVGDSLQVEVFGIGTGVAGEILAHELRARVD